MVLVRAVASYEYEIPDDLDERLEAYGTVDLGECVRIDQENGFELFEGALETGKDVAVDVYVVRFGE